MGSGLFATTQVQAETTSGGSTIVQKIAEKFGLNQSDVQAVFDQDRAEHKAQIEQKFNAKLDQDVKDGKITEAQKQLIIAKRAELEANMKANFESMKDKTPEERKALMESEHQALKDWASQNNIDLKYMGFMRFGGGGPGKGHGMVFFHEEIK